MLKSRRQRLLPFFETHDLDLLLIEHPVNLRYLSGFSGSEGALLLSRRGAGFCVIPVTPCRQPRRSPVCR